MEFQGLIFCLRQGDPLSLMLFILVMDVLGHLIFKAEEEGFLQPLYTPDTCSIGSLYMLMMMLFSYSQMKVKIKLCSAS
jgi:hypothetical protein